MPETHSAAAPTRRPRSRPATLRLLGALLAVLTVLAGVGTASAAPERGHHLVANKPLAGVWDLTVTIHTPDGGTSVVNARFTFTADRQLSAPGPLDGNGQPLYTERGYWNAKSDGTISFYIEHPGVSVGGAVPGDVQAVHLGRISGRTFTTAAYAFVTEQPGATPFGPIDVDTKATWVSPPPTS